MSSNHQIGNPDLLVNVHESLEDRLLRLAKTRGTYCRQVGPQACLFDPDHVENTVQVVNGNEVLTVRADLAARFGLYPQQ